MLLLILQTNAKMASVFKYVPTLHCKILSNFPSHTMALVYKMEFVTNERTSQLTLPVVRKPSAKRLTKIVNVCSKLFQALIQTRAHTRTHTYTKLNIGRTYSIHGNEICQHVRRVLSGTFRVKCGLRL